MSGEATGCPAPLPRGPGIYSVTHLPSGRQYVGASCNVAVRWLGHQRRLGAGTHHNRRLQADWHADGPAAFSVAVLERVSWREHLRDREAYFLRTLRPYYNGEVGMRRPGERSPGRDGTSSEAPAELAPAPEHNPRWEDTPHRQGDPPLRRLTPELAPNTPGGRAARSLGREVRVWRKGRGLTQRELGERLGWAQSAVARLEAGAWAASSGTLVLLASRLGILITFGGSSAQGDAGAVRIADAAPAAE